MEKEELTAVFEKQASSYDQKWSKTAPIRNALYLLTSTVLSDLPSDAKVLCVGSGTGSEILYLAQKFPGWHFTAVEPSEAMLEVFRSRAEKHGIAARCEFHCDYLESLQSSDAFDAATAFLVSQFILKRRSRSEFFQSIADRLCPEGILISADLAGDLDTPENFNLLDIWFRLTSEDGTSAGGIEKMREVYTRDVAVLPPSEVSDIIKLGGFESPVQLYQAGLIHAWFAKLPSVKVE